MAGGPGRFRVELAEIRLVAYPQTGLTDLVRPWCFCALRETTL